MKKIILFLLSLSFYGASWAQNTFPASGNVGIGTSNPLSALQIGAYNGNDTSKLTFPGVYNFEWLNMGQQGNGNSFIELINHTSLTTSYGVRIGTSIDAYGSGLYITTAPATTAYSSLQYGTTPALFINTANNVGIGTKSPAALLDVEGNVNIGSAATRGTLFVNGSTSNVAAITLQNSRAGTNQWTLYGGVSDVKNLDFFNQTLGSEALTISGANNYVGIGTTSPQSSLDVNGEMRISGGAGNELLGGSAMQFVGGYGSPITGRIIIGDDSGWKTFFSSKDYTGTIRDLVTFQDNGNVGIGTTNPQSLLALKGTITAQQVAVTQTGWADYVFNKGYKLRPLSEIGEYIHTHNHLPDIPSTKEVESKGLNLGDMERKQMQKIEELTLYVIRQDKRIARLENEIRAMKHERMRHKTNKK